MSRAEINGVSYDVGPNDLLLIIGNKVRRNHVIVGEIDPNKKLDVTLHGEPLNIDSSVSVTVNGNVQGNVDAMGDIAVTGSVGGNVDGHDVKCGDVKGDIDAMNNVECGKVGGDVDAGGDVIKKIIKAK